MGIGASQSSPRGCSLRPTEDRSRGNSHAIGNRSGLRRACAAVRPVDHKVRAEPAGGQCPDAGNRRRHPGRRGRLSQPPIHHHRRRRRGDLCAGLLLSGLAGRAGLSDRRLPVGRGRLCRHVCFGPGQCAHRRSLAFGSRRRPVGGLPPRRRYRHVGGGPRPVGRGRLLRFSHHGAGT